MTIPEAPDWKAIQKQVDDAAELFCCRRIGEPAVQELIEAAEEECRGMGEFASPRLLTALARIRG